MLLVFPLFFLGVAPPPFRISKRFFYAQCVRRLSPRHQFVGHTLNAPTPYPTPLNTNTLAPNRGCCR
ncbi:hypothetical protein KYK14_04615 [Hymenobacter profundi]|uniref:Secreted protein n=1 Tax=Hymenobacter profundi TaxID=1982110 RepID=A0ABS6WX23_9BACT|nr:hypothetical protein [Hymenobacter profundi]